jgi:flavin-dependent dehydrogenase
VRVFTGENVIDVKKKNQGVEIISSSGKIFYGIFAIAADGRQSRVARVMGLNKSRSFFGSVTSFGYEMTNLDLPEPYALQQALIQSGDPPMLGFIIPRAWNHAGEDVWLVMTTNVDPSSAHEAIFDNFTNKSRFSRWFRNARKVRRCGCSGNIYSPILHPFKDNVLFAGDSGWCQEAEMTGAAMCGWKAGKAVAFAMAQGQYKEDGIKSYINWWKQNHIKRLDYKVFLKNLYLPVLCSDDEIDYIFSRINDPLPKVLDPYEVPEKIGEALLKIIPAVQNEKPDLLQKLSGFKTLPPELVLKKTIRAGFNGNFTI